MKAGKTIATWLGLGALGLVGLILVFAILFALGTAFTAVVVALVWNVFGVHNLFNQDTLSFWQVVGVGAGINILRSIFGGGVKVQG